MQEKRKNRLNRIQDLLSKGFFLDKLQIAQRTGVDRSTIVKDFKVLEELGAEFESDFWLGRRRYRIKQKITL